MERSSSAVHVPPYFHSCHLFSTTVEVCKYFSSVLSDYIIWITDELSWLSINGDAESRQFTCYHFSHMNHIFRTNITMCSSVILCLTRFLTHLFHHKSAFTTTTFVRVQMALSEQTSFALVLLTSITAPLLGAANTLLYSCSQDMRQQIRPSFIWVRTPIILFTY